MVENRTSQLRSPWITTVMITRIPIQLNWGLEKFLFEMSQCFSRFLESDEDMSSLYLTEKREVWQHEEVELLLEGYRLDLEEILISCRMMLAQVVQLDMSSFILCPFALARDNMT